MAGEQLGQNFLTDPAWRTRIAQMLPLGPSATWLEIGAGHGEMTEHLAARAGRVLAIELDSRLAKRLRERAAAWPNVEVREGDVLKLLPDIVPPGPVHVYGNLPYYITSPILHSLLSVADRLWSAHLVMQREVAQRVTAHPGRREYGYLSVASQFLARPAIVLGIPPGAFRPRPKVASALVEMKFPGAAQKLGFSPHSRGRDSLALLHFVQICFAQKRKTLANNLRRYIGENSAALAYLPELLRQVRISQRARAETLSVEQFAALFRAFETAMPGGAEHFLDVP